MEKICEVFKKNVYTDPAHCQLRLNLLPAGPLLADPTLKMNGYSSMLMSGEMAEPKLTCPNSHLPSGEP